MPNFITRRLVRGADGRPELVALLHPPQLQGLQRAFGRHAARLEGERFQARHHLQHRRLYSGGNGFALRLRDRQPKALAS